MESDPSSGRLSGLVASPGSVSGAAVVSVNSIPHRPPRTHPYVLVAEATTPDMVPLLVNAAGIVTDTGGLTSHAANISRELGIPCIVSSRFGSLRINHGDQVMLDATANIVEWKHDRAKCVVCGKHPGLRVFDSDFWCAIPDGYPLREGHLLLVPIRHVEAWEQLTDNELASLPSAVTSCLSLLTARVGAHGINLGMNLGVAAGQTVPHLHFHFVPRKIGDVERPQGGIRHFLSSDIQYP